MVVKPYEVEGSKKLQVSQMFDNIAGKYDFLNHFLSLNMDKMWRRKMIAELDSVQPKTILDVATGTADVAINTIKQLKINDLHIEGVDISAEMLTLLRAGIVRASYKCTISCQCCSFVCLWRAA